MYTCMCLSVLYLKLWPVHAHAWSVGVPPPSEILSVIGRLDGLTQVQVEHIEPVGQSDCQPS